LWRWLQARHEAAHPLLTPGPNALTPAVARVYAEHVVFALNEVVGKDVFAVKPELTRALLKKLLAEWPRMTEAQRKEICDLPFDWANSKQGWPYRPEHQKMELRLNWGKEFSAFFPEIKPFHEARVAEVAKAKAKIAEEQRKRASVPMTAAEQAQQSMNHQMLAMQMATMAMSNQMQMQQQTFQAMQNAQLHMHVANLNIASNIGGGNTTWHVVYR
jgi:hypothetical protein